MVMPEAANNRPIGKVIDQTAAPDRIAKVVFAGSLGTVIEWYDFLIYGTAAALCLNKLFFPTVTPLNGTLAALAHMLSAS